MEYNHIGLLLTENCNARCKMCCDKRGQVKGHTLTREELNLILKRIRDYTPIESIGITGGEPMLYPDLVEYLFQYDFGRIMNFSIKTNGFWGAHKANARKFLKKNRGKIASISFSYDEFHREFIQIEPIKNIIELCTDLKIHTEVVGCFLRDSTTPGEILDEFGEYAYLTKILYQPVIKTGAAKDFPDNKIIKLIDTEKHDIKCMITTIQDYSLAITPKLDVYPCCSQCIENTILCMGNLKTHTLTEIVENITYNKVIHTFFTEGFAPFIKLLQKKHIDFPKKLSHHCEFCEFLFHNDWFLQILENEKYYKD